MTPEQANHWIDDVMSKVFPLGDLKVPGKD
jgi:hypothetical protein